MRRLWLLALLTLLSACGVEANTTYGVSLGPAASPRIHYAVCQGDRIWRVRLDSYQGGSQPGIVLPIFWEVQNSEGSRLTTYQVGTRPPGFVETVPLVAPFPDDLIAIDGPREGLGMSFHPEDDLRPGFIYIGNYSYVTEKAFVSNSHSYCVSRIIGNALGGTILALLAFLVVLLARVHTAGRLGQALVRSSVILLGAYVLFVVIGAGNALLFNDVFTLTDLLGGGLFAGIVTAVYLVPALFILAVVGELGRTRWPRPLHRIVLVATTVALAVGFVLLLGGSLTTIVQASIVALMLGVLIAFMPTETSPPTRPKVKAALVMALAGLGLGIVFDLIQGPIGLAAARWRGDLLEVQSEISKSPQLPRTTSVIAEITGDASDALTVVQDSFQSAGGRHSFYAECDGVSIQVSETYYVSPTQYGSRLIVPCGGEPIESRFSTVPPEGQRVDLYVFPNGIRNWRLVVAPL